MECICLRCSREYKKGNKSKYLTDGQGENLLFLPVLIHAGQTLTSPCIHSWCFTVATFFVSTHFYFLTPEFLVTSQLKQNGSGFFLYYASNEKKRFLLRVVMIDSDSDDSLTALIRYRERCFVSYRNRNR